ncbi:GNAT family N-acetyltransferase [Clostridium neonatale]|uniref:GNAT family N-acetyltransferase n=1 Tax=Clostridium neonatale TaxID=137838 RepID=UPI00291C2C3D|nr:putative acyltransferase, NAT family [Clostridium neonatale]
MKWSLKKFFELTNEEVYKILKLRNEIFIVEQSCPYMDCDGKDEESYHLFAEDGKDIIAYLRMVKKGIIYDDTAIGRVCVNKKYRKNNLGREMLLRAISFIDNELNEKKIKIQAQSYLRDFYKSLGFKEISDNYLEDGILHIDMIRHNKVI